MKRTIHILIILILCNSCNGQSKEFKNYDICFAEILRKNLIDTSDISVIIDKSDYKLTMVSDTLILKEYPVVFGRNAIDDKLIQGDNCTPEGTFYMKDKYKHQKWSRFIWINYPTDDSWKNFNQAISKGKIPKNSKIGGEIGIHGVPEGKDYVIEFKFNWTKGCISMKNVDVNEIYPYITKSTKIIIKK